MDRLSLFHMCLVIAAGFLNAISNVAIADSVTFEPTDGRLIVLISGKEFTTLHHGEALPKPYFWPIRSQDGAILTRPIDPSEREHPHHRGVWLSVDEVNEIKFWIERGKIVTRDVKSTPGDPGQIILLNEWVGRNHVTVLIEHTTISIYANRLITYDVTLITPRNQLVRFDDTKEGLLGIRVAQSMREQAGGLVINSEGVKTAKECWGRPARWIDYSGNVDENVYGVTLMDHPDNFRPSRYHVRDYGLFAISPFGEGAYQNSAGKAMPVILDDAKESIRLRYGLFIHDGPCVGANVESIYRQFTESKRNP